MKKDNTKVTFKGGPVTLVGEPIRTGDLAPNFTLLDKGLAPRTLSDYEGKVKVIAVYPSIDTGICAMQNRKFNELATSMSEDVVVLSVSCDLPFAQSRFCASEGLDNVVTLSDHKETDFGLKYGFLIDELRLLARGTVIIGKDNVVKYVEFVPEIATEPDYDATVKALEAIV
jgi:thioredoxin-dependent peroxiredoxin